MVLYTLVIDVRVTIETDAGVYTDASGSSTHCEF